MKVLVITRSSDHEGVQCTIDAIKRKGGTPIRFDTDRFPTEVLLGLEYTDGGNRLAITNSDGTFDLGDVGAIYYRRVDYAGRLPTDIEPQMRAACIKESTVTVQGLITALPAFQLDPLWRVRMTGNKALQLRVAQKTGLEIPRTLISNDPAAVREFAKSCANGMITKMQGSFAIYEDGAEKVVFTTPVSEADLDDLDGLELSPMQFQEKVDKNLEYRITVVGTKVFSSAVDSAAHDLTKLDWRRDGVGLLDAWKPIDLPLEIEAKLLRLMDILGLQYGAIDVIRTPDNRYVFLEVNPVGEYFWLDTQREVRISDTLAAVLMGEHRRVATGETLSF